VWEANEIERDKAINADFVALDLDVELSTPTAAPEGGWGNLIIEGDKPEWRSPFTSSSIVRKTEILGFTGP